MSPKKSVTLVDFMPPERKVVLRLDALYYRSAVERSEHLSEHQKEIKRCRARFKRLREKEKRILKKHGGDHHAAYDELERIYIQMDGADYKISHAYGPYLRDLAHIHIFCVAALETHINAQAKSSLSGGSFSEFDRLSLTGKWLFLPRLLGFESFHTDRQPFQGLANLVRIRNKLVHYNEQAEDWSGNIVPTFLPSLGFKRRDAMASIKTANSMIGSLAIKMGEEVPDWLGFDVADHFEFRIMNT